MQKELIQIPADIKIVGLAVRTNKKNEDNPAIAKVGSLVQQYFSQGIAGQIAHRKNPGVTCRSTADYSSDIYGDYTFVIGEEVTSFKDTPPTLKQIVIPAGSYIKFTTEPGAMPLVLVEAWQQVWQMSEKELGGKRTYKADLQIVRPAADPTKSIVEMYVGIEQA